MLYIHGFIYSFILFIVFVTTLMLDMSIQRIHMTTCFKITCLKIRISSYECIKHFHIH